MMSQCARPKCPNKGSAGLGLCHKHYELTPMRGYVDPSAARQHLTALRDRGVTIRSLRDYGLSRMGVKRVMTADRIRRTTERTVLDIPLPGQVFTLADVDGTGTRRRIQALVALGWPQRMIGDAIGIQQHALSAIALRDRVTAASAAKVRDIYDRWSMVPGPSEVSRRRARKRGWVPPLAWDDNIDDPNAVPDVGVVRRWVPFPERYAELSDVLALPDSEVAAVLGIQVESLHRQLDRYGMRSA